jgi:peptide chain release factor 2
MTFEELKNRVAEARERLSGLGEYLDVETKRAELAEIEGRMSAPDFWDDKESAQKTMGELSSRKKIVSGFDSIKSAVDDFSALGELVAESQDEDILSEADEEWKKLEAKLSEVELLSFLSGRFDANNAYFSIHAGAGGTESCDWTEMLSRMYRRWFDRRGWTCETIDSQPGDEAGLKSVTMRVRGDFAYGYLRAERGVHRLVRISPFDSNARRHTSFASVEAFPELDDEIDIEIDEKDLKVDTFRASGAGGQHVNTTDSAIRITHVPSGVVVSCQAERSQHKNRSTAMRMLKAKLYELEEEKKRREAAAIQGEKTEMGWGNQIRSYVLHPYQMVKDLRTGAETGNTSAVLDGDLDQFVEAWLKMAK